MKLFSIASWLLMFSFSSIGFGAAFQNGSFESPGGAPIFKFLGCNDAFVTGWINDASNCAGLQVYESSGIFGTPSAGDGSYYTVFGGNGTHGGTLQQTFDTIVGATYNVNYLVFLSNPNDTNLEPQSMRVQAFDGVNLLGSSVDNNFTNLAWANGPTLTFTATSTSTTLLFTDTTTPTSFEEQNWGLDGVTAAGTVPEPGSFIMVAAALGGLLASWYRPKTT